MNPEEHEALIAEDAAGVYRRFSRPTRVIAAYRIDEVRECLQRVEIAVEEGAAAAGFIAYEAASGFDHALETHEPEGGKPLLWFGLFEDSQLVLRRELERDRFESGRRTSESRWRPSMGPADHRSRVERIKQLLAEGETYQVNLTFKLTAHHDGPPFDLFLDLSSDYRLRNSAFVSTDDFAIICASPELFFELNNGKITSQPMKGTAARGATTLEDDKLAKYLESSEKNRAENLMIVDMIRNDLGKVCDSGSIRVRRPFEVVRYWTVLQMISTVEGTTSAGICEVMGALFPCASVTGAPKVRTMSIIRDLEPGPRGLYTGCVGYMLPGGRARFGVAIRSVWLDRRSGAAEYGVGGGIVWDSSPEEEYRECLLKGRALAPRVPDFDVLETILWEQDQGYFLLDRHLNRLAGSARYFGYPLDRPALEQKLRDLEDTMRARRAKVRVLVGRDGTVAIESTPIDTEIGDGSVIVAIARKKILSEDVFVYHKTTHRKLYEEAIENSKTDDVILINQHDQITETTFANIVVEIGGKLVTPPVKCGLLPGTFREHLLDSGEIKERIIMRAELEAAPRILLINSVRRWIPATLVPWISRE